MRITIFPKANPHPKSREEKQQQGKHTSYPVKGQIVTISDENQLVDYICNNAWSPSLFHEYRRNDDFLSTDFVVLDVDDTLKMQDAESRLDTLKCCYLLLPSPSFTEEVHKYRIIVPLVKSITDKDIFDSTLNWFLDKFPEADAKCKDYARFYFGCTAPEKGVWVEGGLFEPIVPKFTSQELESYMSSSVDVQGYDDLTVFGKLYGQVPKRIPQKVDYFLKNANTGLDGHWTLTLNDFVFSLGLQGVKDEVIEDVVAELAPKDLDKIDQRTIKIALRDAKTYAIR